MYDFLMHVSGYESDAIASKVANKSLIDALKVSVLIACTVFQWCLEQCNL